MALLLSLLLVVPLIQAKVIVTVVASDNASERVVELSGSDVEVISDAEKVSFQLSDGNLKSAIKVYFGNRPDNAFIRSPTPWGDLYKTYGWEQVTRVFVPQRAKIVEVTSQPTIVLVQHFQNNSTKSASFIANIQQAVANTVTSNWETFGELTISQQIQYGFDIKVYSIGGKTSVAYTSKWGEAVSRSETVTVGSESGVQITLEPKQSVMAELYATRGTMRIKIDYEATLSGSTVVNYKTKHRGHHFWALPINGVMSAGGLPRNFRSTEVITLGYFSDARVIIRDTKSHMLLYSIPMSIL